MMKLNSLLLQLLTALIIQPSFSDPGPLHDFCIADKKSSFSFNGAPCINPKSASSSHFTTSALGKPGNTGPNPFGFNLTLTDLINLPGLNTLGLSMARVDIEPNGLIPPHAHPRASEVTICLKGTIQVGFLDTSNQLFTEKLRPGDSFVFPLGLVHFLYNVDSNSPAMAVAGLSSQSPGVRIGSNAGFASEAKWPDEVLMMALQMSGQDSPELRRNLGG